MRFLRNLIIYSTCFFIFSSTAFASDFCDFYGDMVILGADCDKNLHTRVPISSDPLDSKFVKMVEDGECSGIVYDDTPMPACVAGMIMDVDPSGSYFIHKELGGYTYVDGGTLDNIVLKAEPGNNIFSIPWNWLVKLSGFADEEVYKEIYDLNDLPSCDPNNLSNEYSLYSEIA